MKIMLLLSPIVLGVYLLWCNRRYGMTKSISATWYVLKESEKWIFGTMWWVYSIPIIYCTLDYWFISAVFMLVLVAINPNYKVKRGLQDFLHYFGSYATIILGIVGLANFNFIAGLVYGIVVAAFTICLEVNFRLFAKIKNDTYWQEVLVGIPLPIVLYFIL